MHDLNSWLWPLSVGLIQLTAPCPSSRAASIWAKFVNSPFAKMTMEPITLKEAAERYRFKLATLRHEAKRGTLAVYKMGKAFYTTPRDIEAMVEKCRVQPAHTSTSTGRETPGASGMALDQSELDAVLLTRLAPKSSSRNTSPASTDRRRRQALASGT
jgi:hypothetical protein